MDELEISGKRFISTRRAAKEYGYHADYISQLIRGKKLLGRKVGRSWYVEMESLTEYFGNEAQLHKPSEIVAKAVVEEIKDVQEEKKKEIVEEPTEEKIEPVSIAQEEEKIETEEPARDSIHIPIRRPSFEPVVEKRQTTLRYVSDDAPTLPRAYSSLYSGTAVMPQTQEEVQEVVQERFIPRENKEKRFGTPQLIGISLVGGVVLVLVMFTSIMVNTHLVIEAGKAASVGYSLQ